MLDKNRAFELLFRQKTYDAVWYWLVRLGVPRHHRKEVAQDVLLAALESFHAYDPHRSRPERWLNMITIHVAAHYHERAMHRPHGIPLSTTYERRARALAELRRWRRIRRA